MADSGDSAVYIAVGMSIVAVLLAVGVTYTIKTVKRVRAVAKAAPVPEIEAPQAAEKAPESEAPEAAPDEATESETQQ